MTDRPDPKLQALGLLVAGVAHDFNNLLAIIEGYSYVLQQRLEDNPALQDKISAILSASHRGTELTQTLLDFYADNSDHNACVSQVIQESKPILRALLSSRIELEFQMPSAQVTIELSKNELIQELIFMAAAMGKTITGAGCLTISANVTQENLSLTVMNNATGEYAANDFRIATNKLQDKTILVVDDEESLLPVLEHQLESLGMKVLKAANADTALLLQKNYPGSIDFLLTDVVMPDIDGIQLAEMISDNRPRMGVVYMTGQGKIDVPEQSLVLPKPLKPEALSQVLQKALEEVADA